MHKQAKALTLAPDCEVSEDFPVVQGNKAIELLTLTGCNGGNHFEQYAILAINFNSWKTTSVIPVGNDRSFVASTVNKGDAGFYIDGAMFAPDDAHCCPTIPTIRHLSIKKQTLTIVD